MYSWVKVKAVSFKVKTHYHKVVSLNLAIKSGGTFEFQLGDERNQPHPRVFIETTET